MLKKNMLDYAYMGAFTNYVTMAMEETKDGYKPSLPRNMTSWPNDFRVIDKDEGPTFSDLFWYKYNQSHPKIKK